MIRERGLFIMATRDIPINHSMDTDDTNNSFDWIHVYLTDNQKVLDVQKEFDIPDYVINNAKDTWEVPRTEHWPREESEMPDIIVLKYPHRKKGNLDMIEFETYPITVIIFDKTILTFTKNELPFISESAHERFLKLQTDDKENFILSLIWNIGAEYLRSLDIIHEEIQRLEEKLQHSTHSKQLYGMMALKKSIVFFETSVSNNHPVIKELENYNNFTETEKNQQLFHRVLIEVKQSEKTIEQTEKLLRDIGEVYSSAISNNLNNIMKFLSSITIILSFPSIIGAWWGMNVPVPLEQNPFGFVILVLFSILLVFLGGWYFYKKNYL